MKAKFLRLATVAAWTLAPATSPAAVVSWIGDSGEWVDGDAGNALWNPADEPDADDTARFEGPHNVMMGSDNEIARLELALRTELYTSGRNLHIAEAIRLLSGGGVKLAVEQGSVVSAASWHVEPAAALVVQGGELRLREQPGAGQGVVNGDAYLSGFGTVTADGFTTPRVAIVNDGILMATGSPDPHWGDPAPGELRLRGAHALIDLDGGTEGGIVAVEANQTLKLELPITDAYSVMMNLSNNSRFESSHAWTFDAGMINADNGEDLQASALPQISYISGAKLRQTGGTINVTDPDGRLDVVADFQMDGGAIVNRGRIAFQGDSLIAGGTAFGGGGTYIVGPAGRMAVAPDATMKVHIENNGELRPGGDDSIGNLSLQGFQQTRTGKLFLELSGAAPALVDRVTVNAPAYLEGLLNIDVDGNFAPTLGATFEVLTSVGGVRGRFNQIDVSGMPEGLTLLPVYQPTSILLQVISKPDFAADLDEDGDVDSSDLAVWKSAYGHSAAGDANGDLVTDGEDFLLIQRQFGSGPTAAVVAVPEPATCVLAAAGLCGMLLLRIRRPS